MMGERQRASQCVVRVRVPPLAGPGPIGSLRPGLPAGVHRTVGNGRMESGPLYTRAEEALIREGILGPQGVPLCPRCGGGLDRRDIPPRPDVAYVRTRLLIVCNGCGRSVVLDRHRGDRPEA